jgi:acyl-CoA synthetase (AMP-forming)/AMP-acid ligase II
MEVPATLSMRPAHWAGRRPDAAAVVMAQSGATVTWSQLEERSARLARLLRRRGLRSGDHVAVLLENQARYLEVIWAAQRSGLYHTPVNRHLSPAEVAYILDDCGARAVVTSARLAAAAGELVRIDTGIGLMMDGAVHGFEAYEEAIAACAPEALDEEIEGSAMLYSSGTTARPKGILRPLSGAPFGSGTAADQFLAELYGFGEDTVYLCPAPLYHAAPLIFSLAVQRCGGTVVLMEDFDPLLTLETIERHRVTHAQFVPTMFIRMLRLPGEHRRRWDISSLRVAIHAAAPCPVAVKEAMLEWWGPIVHEYYASSEAGFVCIGPEEWLAHKGSVGRPEGDSVHILDETGRELPRGESGVVYFEGWPAFEYHHDVSRTATAFTDRGWVTVGDIGHLDADGYLHLTDRRDHMIISGGVNISPRETEDVLLGHPAVLDVAVIGVPDVEYGEAVKAVVQPVDITRAGADLEGELIAWCRARLAHYKCPRTVDFRAELPRLPTGKLLKRVVRAAYWPTS